jgi:hypothetical protein
VTFTAADLAFDAAAHTYTLPDGRQVPSVTQILKGVGISTDFDALGAISDQLRDRIDYRRALGTAVHADAHSFDDGVLDEATVHPEVVPLLEAWKVFRENTRLVPLTRERRVFDPRLFYCGTLDGIFRTPSGRNVLIDIKTGDPEASGARYQLAAYHQAWSIQHPEIPVSERWSVRLTPENGVPYRISTYTDWSDFGKFAAFVTTYHARPRSVA